MILRVAKSLKYGTSPPCKMLFYFMVYLLDYTWIALKKYNFEFNYVLLKHSSFRYVPWRYFIFTLREKNFQFL